MKWIAGILILAGLVLVSCSQEDPSITGADDPLALESGVAEQAAFAAEATFEITIENLSPATGDISSQIFSPPVIATHNGAIYMFRQGEVASSEMYQIAEDAVNGRMVDLLNASDLVHAVVEGTDVIAPQTSATYTITAMSGFTRLSVATMLVNTNDAFTGVSRLKLPISGSATIDLIAWDAGSEENTELLEHIPGPCCASPLVRVPTVDPVKKHRGILGVGDLDPAIYGWDEPVGRLTITRLD